MSLKTNLDELVYQTLCKNFADGTYSSGQALSPAELSERYGISRTPIIQALKWMSIEGIIDVNGTGKYSIPSYSAADLHDLYEARVFIECGSARELCENATDKQIAYLSRLTEQMPEATLAGRHAEFVELDRTFHRSLVDFAGNSTLTGFYDVLVKRLLVATYIMVQNPQHNNCVNAEHAAIVRHLKARDAAKLEAVLASHIRAVCDRLRGSATERGGTA